MRTLTLMRPFHRDTNLHGFIREIATDIVMEEVEQEDGEYPFLRQFFKVYGLHCPTTTLESEDAFGSFTSESDRFHDALDELTDEVFHVLFNDVGFLQNFNLLCAGYIDGSGFGEEWKTRNGTLKRVPIPVWARRATFHRDKNECRICRRSLAALINRLETERYDHIVPLAQFGANDVTNLQLLCEPCILKRFGANLPVSRLYQRATDLKGAVIQDLKAPTTALFPRRSLELI